MKYSVVSRRVAGLAVSVLASIPHVALATVFVTLLLARSTEAAGLVPPTSSRPVVVSWRFEIRGDGASSPQPLADAARKRGIDVRARSTAAGGLELEGTNDTATLRAILSGKVLPGVDLIGGVAVLEIRAPTEPGRSVRIELPSNPSTGAHWALDSQDWVTVGEPLMISDSGVPGAVGREVHRVRAARTTGVLRLVYRRPWLPDASADRTLTIEAGTFPSLIDLARPGEFVARVLGRECRTPRMKESLGLGPEENEEAGVLADQAVAAASTLASLPPRFDWRDHGVVSSVKDQGSCGSCWAFAAVAASEAAVALATQQAPLDYSEQYLVSCDSRLDGCDGGWGDMATDLHVSVVPNGQDDAGPVLERDLPYQGTAGTCLGSLPHAPKLIRWVTLVDRGSNVPSEAEVKAALLEHGPLIAGICEARAFQDYRRGVLKKDERKFCACGANHEVLLVGWDDSDRSWIVKNSWGEGWGDRGYARIRRGISNFPFWAAYPVYDPAPEPLPAYENGNVENPLLVPAYDIEDDGVVMSQSVGLQAYSPGPVFPGTESAFATPTNMVWYEIRPERNGLLTLETLASNYDTVVGLWRRHASAEYELVAWNDDLARGTGMRPSFLQTEVDASSDYVVGVSSFDPEVRGRLELGIRLSPGRSGEILDDRDSPRIQYDGTWSLEDEHGSYQGYVHKGTRHAIASLELEEGPFQVVYPMVVGAGTLDVYLDGKRITRLKQGVKVCTAERQRIVYEGVARGAGVHRLELVQSGNGPIYLDAVLLGDVLLPDHIEPR